MRNFSYSIISPNIPRSVGIDAPATSILANLLFLSAIQTSDSNSVAIGWIVAA
jgi:hypothetical protein